MNNVLKNKKPGALLLLCFFFSVNIFAKTAAPAELIYPRQVSKFYALNYQRPFWFAPNSSVRQRFLAAIDNAPNLGLNKEKYHYTALKAEPVANDSAGVMQQDKVFTDAVIAFCKDVYQGANTGGWLKADEVSGKYAARDDDYIVTNLVKVNSPAAAEDFLATLEPKDQDYTTLKNELHKQLEAGNTHLVKQLNTALNFHRWIHHFNFDKYIVVNIPAAKLRYYENGNRQLEMKTVVGKPKTRTPRFTAYCYQVILYPYWNVPNSIAVNELIPKFKKHPGAMNEMNIEVINSSGSVVNQYDIDWSSVDASNFPYRFRQATGCDNSLGVIKFDLTDDFNVYMHDTNNKPAFESMSRYLSHGCIRLEKPLDLANALLNNRVDEDFVRACIHDQKPVINKIKPVPVFVIYNTAVANGDAVSYLKDIYGLN